MIYIFKNIATETTRCNCLLPFGIPCQSINKKIINILCFFVGLLFISSCINKNTPRNELPFNRIIAEDLFTSFPGPLRVTSNHILMMDPFNFTGFLKVYDRRMGEEILSAGTIGRGPGEWNNPDISNVIIVEYDLSTVGL